MARILMDARELEELSRVHRDAAAELEDISVLLGGLVVDRVAVPTSAAVDGPLDDVRRAVMSMRAEYVEAAEGFARLAEDLRSHAPLTRLLHDLWTPQRTQAQAVAPTLGHGIEQLRRLAGAQSGAVADLLRLAHG